MIDDVLLNKAAIIERALARALDEYEGHENALETDFRRQDAIVLNLQRACQGAIDGAMHLVRVRRLGLPQESRDAFTMLRDADLIEHELTDRLHAMVGFRNVAIHDYQALSIPVLRGILERDHHDLQEFAQLLTRWASSGSADASKT